MRNYARFQDKIDVSRAISIIKDLTCLVRNSSKASMKNDMLDFNMIKFFLVLILVLVKFFVLFLLDVSFLDQAGLKLTLMGLLGDILVLLLVEVFSVGVRGSLLVLSFRLLKFSLLWLLSFMELYMLWRKLKRWGLLMYDLNVILPWFVLHLLLGLMFHGCFVIDGTLVFTMGKSELGLLIFFVKGMCALISWLIRIYS